jgi:pimeloyl-ACP methyl ester carboxylesterase
MHTSFSKTTRSALALIGLLSLAWLAGCGPENAIDPTENRVKLEHYVKLTTISKSVIRGVSAQNDVFAQLTPFMDYDMTLYRVIYKTNYLGEEILASGLVSIPQGVEEAPPLLSAQHGTIFGDNAAPSNFVVNLLTGGVLGLELFGAAGYITIVPDFIGYGQSGNIQHPYYDKALTASATIDMMLASKEFLAEIGITYSDKLFLFGYSEGGFATMATLQALEEQPSLGLNVTAAAAGAGGFYIKGIMNHVLGLEEHPEPGFLGFVVRSYNQTYGWRRPYTDFFQEPYATRISDGLLDGGFTKDEVNAQLTTVLADYIQPDFKQGLLDGTETEMLEAMARNTVHNWAPKGNLRLFHSPNDEVLTIQNSHQTLDSLHAAGATHVTLHETGGNSHAEGVFHVIEEVIVWFNSLK